MNYINKIKRKLMEYSHKLSKVEQIIDSDLKELKILRNKIKSINDTQPLGTSSWESNRRLIRSEIINNDINNFLNWEVIQKTMFFEAPEVEYQKIIKNKQLFSGIKESKIGNPKPYLLNKNTSGNLIHHAYSLSYFLDITNLDKINRVIEFGGGYGSMCRLFRNLNYKNEYVIFDLPEFSALQEFYIGCINIDYLNNTIFTGDENLLNKHCSGTLFVATWSFSEMLLELREQLLKNLTFDYCLIAFQSSFEGIDNN